LLPGVASVTCKGVVSTTVTVKSWFEFCVQVTENVTVGDVTAADTGPVPVVTVWGPLVLVQSAGKPVSVNWASALAGWGPLLCTWALAETSNGVPALALPGPATLTLCAFKSASAVTTVGGSVTGELPKLLPGVLSMSVLEIADEAEKVWNDVPQATGNVV